MRIFYTTRARRVFGTLLLCFAALHSGAQTLARPGWVGSGLSAEVWWRNAVFYRITPATFQDSDGNGKGDLRGIVQRLSYLQSLSVDAVVLEAPFDETGFDDLLSEASRRHIRLLIAISPTSDGSIANEARSWLTRGVAGIWLRVPAKMDASQTASLVHALRTLTDSFPGQRVLVEDTSADLAALPAAGAQLIARQLMAGIGDHTDALSLRVQLAQLSSLPQGSSPVILLGDKQVPVERDAQHREALQKILATALLLSRGAAAIEAGQELGEPATDTIGSTDKVMQWTPSNITRPPAAEPVAAPPARLRRENEYGPFVPYVAPKKLPAVGTKPDLDALPGFSSVIFSSLKSGRAAAHESVASEDADPNSVLNFYRRLSQLHHENATLRSGTSSLLNYDQDNVLVWLRKAPSNARTSSTVLIACNLADSAKTISLVSNSAALSPRPIPLHPLLTSASVNAQIVQRTSDIVLAPWSVAVLSFGR